MVATNLVLESFDELSQSLRPQVPQSFDNPPQSSSSQVHSELGDSYAEIPANAVNYFIEDIALNNPEVPDPVQGEFKQEVLQTEDMVHMEE